MRTCVDCPADISDRNTRAILCPTCLRERKRERERKPRQPRFCEDCGTSLADRDHQAYLCLECASTRHKAYVRRRAREMRLDPVRLEADRAYHREWQRKRSARRVLEILPCAMCDKPFQMNRIGRRRLVCVGCTAINAGYISVTRYIATAKRRSERDRQRRRAA